MSIVEVNGRSTDHQTQPASTEIGGGGMEVALVGLVTGTILVLAAVAAALICLSPVPARSASNDVPVQSQTTTTTAAAKISWLVCGTGQNNPLVAPRGVTVSERTGEIVLANTGSHRIEIYDLQGRPRGGYPHQALRADGSMAEGEPHWVAVDASGRTLVSDNLDASVDVLDVQGHSLKRFKLQEDANSPSGSSPGALALLADSVIVVASRGNAGRIHFFSPDFVALGSWGDSGLAPGQLSQITGIAAAPTGELVVICANTELAIQIFARDGKFVRGFGKHDLGPGTFSFPSGVAVSADGRIYVSDEIRQLVQAFEMSGNYIGSLGTPGTRPGEFRYPSAVATYGKNTLVVTERVGSRFQLYATK